MAWPVRRPAQRLDGSEVTGVTVMLMDEGLDSGPIRAWAESPVGPEEDAGTLGARLAEAGEVGHWEILGKLSERAGVGARADRDARPDPHAFTARDLAADPRRQRYPGW